ncbi:helix-turn-helix transcriptional regulator [Myxococcus sp. RHSTA-1-4]|uniref:helix-turn-helix transcriptional regulator n=1 Tax=Myxococcus sp. RHSTA-1-4 TaxID=2874601 RepID=UPI001CBEEFF8|nr:helix-turn-helix domain-containing protein [Myxococcus sp. RHSTA-1-4]
MNEAVSVPLGRGLRDARLRTGLTPAQVADAARLPPEAYVRIERGKLLPTLPALYLLCRALGIRADWLRGEPSANP